MFIDKLLFLKLKYSNYGKVISPDRMIQVTAFVNDKENREYHKAEKLIVLDEPALEVKVGMDGQRSVRSVWVYR